jgi:hypothetical protein
LTYERPGRKAGWALTAAAAAILMGTIAWMATMPVTVSI